MNFKIRTLKRDAISPALWQVRNPPEILYFQGSDLALEKLSELPERGLAIVGTREPQQRSIQLVRNWIHAMNGVRLIIVSGFARGIDAAAHSAAIEAGLPTIAFLGGGIDIAYPAENQRLRERILLNDGLLISEFPPGTEHAPFNFLNRNRFIAAWAKATWVVEASHRSGALNTANWARQRDHLVYATPCSPGDPIFAGNQTLIDRDEAVCAWGPHSFGQTWLELSSAGSKKKAASSDEDFLVSQVTELSKTRGGASVSELLDWSITNGYSPENFFSSLQRSLQLGKILDIGGILISPAKKVGKTLVCS